MARKVNGLTARSVAALKEPGYYGDGNGLYLQITPGGRSWVFRYQIAGRRRDMGLGPVDLVPLAEARDRAHAARKLVLDGHDPIDAKHAERDAKRAEVAKAITFKACAEKCIGGNRAGWKNAKHAAQWTSTLATYAYPVIGELPVGDIDTGHITKILEPIWAGKTETATRVRQRIERVLDYATTNEWREGANPARWKGHLDNILPKPTKVTKVEHHAALPWQEIGSFMADLHGQVGIAAEALKFAIYTAARTGEVLGAHADEFNLDDATWVIPASRTKTGKELRVPLSAPALEIARGHIEAGDGGDGFLFPLSNMAMLKLLERMGRGDLTVHGFRSTFRDWAAERTNYPNHVVEMALGHAIGSKTESAYRRGDMLDKRRHLMEAWGSFCAAPPAEGATVRAIRG